MNETQPTPTEPASDKFSAHLKAAAETVATWPEWKQEVLGGTATPAEPASEPGELPGWALSKAYELITEHAWGWEENASDELTADQERHMLVLAKALHEAVPASTLAAKDAGIERLREELAEAKAKAERLDVANTPYEDADQRFTIKQPDGQSWWQWESPGVSQGPFSTYREAHAAGMYYFEFQACKAAERELAEMRSRFESVRLSAIKLTQDHNTMRAERDEARRVGEEAKAERDRTRALHAALWHVAKQCGMVTHYDEEREEIYGDQFAFMRWQAEAITTAQATISELRQRVGELELAVEQERHQRDVYRKTAATASNYIADSEQSPTTIWLACGRKIEIKFRAIEKVAGLAAYLDISSELHPAFEQQLAAKGGE